VNLALLQCVITVPDKYSQEPSCQMRVDRQTGDIQLRNTCGTTVIFDSFSSEEEVRQRNVVKNSVSKLNDTSRHFLANLNISIASPVAAVLSPASVQSYRTVDRKPPPIETKQPIIITEFDMEIERRKRQCAMLFGDIQPPNKPQRFLSMAEALLSMNPENQRGSFADALRKNPFLQHAAMPVSPPSSSSPCSSSEMIACCHVSKRHVHSPPRSSEEIAVSALREFGNM
jgi:hypothetical protein